MSRQSALSVSFPLMHIKSVLPIPFEATMMNRSFLPGCVYGAVVRIRSGLISSMNWSSVFQDAPGAAVRVGNVTLFPREAKVFSGFRFMRPDYTRY